MHKLNLNTARAVTLILAAIDINLAILIYLLPYAWMIYATALAVVWSSKKPTIGIKVPFTVFSVAMIAVSLIGFFTRQLCV